MAVLVHPSTVLCTTLIPAVASSHLNSGIPRLELVVSKPLPFLVQFHLSFLVEPQLVLKRVGPSNLLALLHAELLRRCDSVLRLRQGHRVVLDVVRFSLAYLAKGK